MDQGDRISPSSISPLILNWFLALGAISAGVVEGFNGKAKLTTRKAYGFRTPQGIEFALFHVMGNLPEPEFNHRFCRGGNYLLHKQVASHAASLVDELAKAPQGPRAGAHLIGIGRRRRRSAPRRSLRLHHEKRRP